MTDTTETVVETTAPDANVAPDVENVADPSPAVNDADEKPKGVAKRIDELTRNWREEQRRSEQLMRLLEQQRTQPEPVKPIADEKPKTLADFEYDEAKFQQYIFDQAEKRASEAAKRELTAAQEREAAERRKASFRSRSAEFAKTVEDFESVAYAPGLPISADMAEVIQDSDDGPALLFHLGKNPDIAEKIAQLPPKAAARELGKIEARLAYEREKAKEKPVVSKAPPPPPKVEGSDPAPRISTTDPDSDKLSDDEWVKAELARLKRKANRK